ncbi:coiled-coil domain-containing protein 42 homolog [Octopus bimaculoides]|uniref:DUF4200 domain-containing protein n=1 Tax=Octopus bimaculoides TaxID=37653 RepID=A0A0L8HDU0_OCTBM|nr:coiled-coil domain-containing protein 42 homolog [Octopus bimaculoides]|eukprot:XP_014773116.1 PREDICTED: coiled-coil domain-containing protein 42 homolog [Octopus bimaculoides]
MMNLEEYFKTTFENKLLFKMLKGEDDHLTPATRLLEKRRELAEIEQVLSVQKEEFQTKMERLQQRRGELERKELQLKESLEKFDKFLKENDSKRIRAIKKANDQRELKRSKMREIAKFQDDLRNLIIVNNQLKKRQKLYHKFCLFMQKILNSCDEFHEIRDIIARYDTLISTYTDLLETERKHQDLIEAIKIKIHSVTEEKCNEILAHNNQLSNLQVKYESSRSTRIQLESIFNHVHNTASVKALKSGQIQMAAHNLFNVMRTYQNLPPAVDGEPNSLEELNCVRIFGEDLVFVTNTVKPEKAKEHYFLS